MLNKSLYQSAIKQHYRHPIGFQVKFTHQHQIEGSNPNCGDDIELFISLNYTNASIEQISFDGDACAICVASCSLLCQLTPQQSLVEVSQLAQQLDHSLKQQQALTHPVLNCLDIVSHYPSRVSCALLPWQTLTDFFQSKHLV